MDLDEVRVIGVIAPDLGEELVLGQRLAAVADEEGEQPQLGGGQRDLASRRASPIRRARR